LEVALDFTRAGDFLSGGQLLRSCFEGSCDVAYGIGAGPFLTAGMVKSWRGLRAASNAAQDARGLRLIKIGADDLNHVVENHYLAKFPGKSLFSPLEDPVDLIRASEGVMPIPQEGGVTLIRTVDAGRVIGLDRQTGMPTTIYTVVTTKDDELKTAFPGRPGR
jgi:hypothetical protein